MATYYTRVYVTDRTGEAKLVFTLGNESYSTTITVEFAAEQITIASGDALDTNEIIKFSERNIDATGVTGFNVFESVGSRETNVSFGETITTYKSVGKDSRVDITLVYGDSDSTDSDNGGSDTTVKKVLNLGKAIPKKGVDYWTETDKQEINAESQAYIVEELAKRGQLKPEFANSVAELEESGDTSKLYVLPDGYIYAHMYYEKTPVLYINLANQGSSDWFDGTRLNSSGEQKAAAEVDTTNFISVTQESTLHIKGLDIMSNVASGENYDRIHFFGTQKNFIMQVAPASSKSEWFTTAVYDSSVMVVDLAAIIAYYEPLSSNVVYIRVTGIPTDSDIIITDGQDIVEGTSEKICGWANTGNAFVPADYEDRITVLETASATYATRILDIDKKNTAQDERIAALEAGQSSGGGGTSGGGTSSDELPPDYWITAIDNLSGTIKAKQASGVDAFQFVWFSDMHGATGYVNTNGAGTSSQENIGKVAQYLCDTFDIPLVATSGDILSQTSYPAVSSVYAEYEKCREILKYIDTEKFLAVIGNHDGAWGAAQNGIYYLKDIGERALYNEIYRKQATDLKRVFGTGGSYFYVDSYPQKVRIFMLNSNTDGDGSNDSDGNAVYNSQKYSVYGTEQLEWLANSLNSTPEGFTVIAMAHQPLNTSKDGSLVAGMLTAYNKRGTYSGTASLADTYWGNGLSSEYNTSSISCDFASAKGEFAAFFCGHIHQDATYTDYYDFPMISITTAGSDVRGNNPVKRVVGTATETALDVVTIDKLNRKIYMTRVGAGSDREVSY